MRLDLETGKEEEILRMNDVYIQLFAARKDALIFYTQELLPPDEMTGPLGDKMNLLPARLQIWTESSGTATTIFEKTNEQFPTVLNIYGGKLYYYGQKETSQQYTYDFATGEHKKVELPDGFRMVNDDYWYVHGELNTTIYDFHTGQPVSGDFGDWQISFQEIGEQGFIGQFWLFSGKTEEGKYIKEREIYGYVPFAAMEDGLQKEDIRIIYEKKY